MDLTLIFGVLMVDRGLHHHVLRRDVDRDVFCVDTLQGCCGDEHAVLFAQLHRWLRRARSRLGVSQWHGPSRRDPELGRRATGDALMQLLELIDDGNFLSHP